MKLLIVIPVMDQYEIGRCSLATWDWLTSPAADFLLLDNGSTCDWKQWLLLAHLKCPERWHYMRNEENVGMVRSAQQAYDYAAAHGYDLLALTHNDVWVWQPEWDVSLSRFFKGEPLYSAGSDVEHLSLTDRIGGVGFFGSKGCNKDGMRLNTFGNVLDCGHGRRMTAAWEPAVIFDGFFQCYSMEMLRLLRHKCQPCDGVGMLLNHVPSGTCAACMGSGIQQGGFDQRYAWMHIYDYDFSLESVAAGWKNAVLNVPCHHLSGLTANNAAARTSGQDVMQANIKRFHAKWDSRLGVTVNDADWSYRWELG